MPTRDQIANKIRDNLHDAGVTYYSLADIHESIQDGYDEVAVYCECIDKKIDITVLPNTSYYDLSTLIPDYFRIYSEVYHNEFNHYLNPVLDRELLNGDAYWELRSYQERDYVVLGPKYLGLSGRSANPVGTIGIRYKASADTLNGTTIPRILPAFQVLLENYGTADLLEQNQEFVKATGYWNSYNVMLEEYRYKIQLLSRSDRIFTRT